MLGSLVILAASFEVLPFYQQKPDYTALRPIWSHEGDTTDVLWPVFTAHKDWWRFCYFTHYQTAAEGGYQFEILPLWWNGETQLGEDYMGLFPIAGYHPHFLLMYDFKFCLWPIWMQYKMPRPKDATWMTTNAILFPLFHWRDDGSWGLFPLCGVSHNREDDHFYALWPLWNWKTCFPDRDTGGEGYSWMLWPLCGRVNREREQQWLFLPPFFSYAETNDGWRGRFPLPIVEIERMRLRNRTSVFPFYEHIENFSYVDGEEVGSITRFGWRLVEILPNETRVFPFYVNGDDYFRLWPLWESNTDENGVWHGRFLSLFPIRWVDSVNRNWSKFWTLYETESAGSETRHSLFWGLIRWSTDND